MIKPEKNTPCFLTQQVFIIATNDEDGSPHFAPISWISYTYGNPACLVISIGGVKTTKKNIERDKRLSATLVTPDLLPFIEYQNKATMNPDYMCDIKFERGKVVDVPLIKGAKMSYECEILKKVTIGDTDTYFAEIKHINVCDEVLKLDFFDLRKINPVVYSPDNYFTIGEHLGCIGDYSKKNKK